MAVHGVEVETMKVGKDNNTATPEKDVPPG
jgi:hypothetical protein